MPEEKRFGGKRAVIYIIGFVFNLSYAIPTYVNSSFLAKFTTPTLVGIIYTAASILAIAAFVEMPDMLRRFGNFRTTIALILIEILSLAGLATGSSSLVVISAFLLNFVTIAIITFTLDVFLEEFSSDKRTGKIRGMFLTIANTAWLISPFLAALILGDNMYQNIYAVSGALLIPVIILMIFSLNKVEDPAAERIPFWRSFGLIWMDRNLKSILLIQFLLQFFYAWMVIYTPIYLHDTIGFDWPTIGIIFTVMLAPFVILQAPLGRIADRYGEKKMLSLGFIIMGISTGIIAFVTDHNAIVWAAILFSTRVGAAMVEVMADTYFFKKVDATKTSIIGFFRTTRPLAYVISPVLATLLFTVFDMKGLFIFLGLLMFYGLRYSLSIEDTRRMDA